jgi:hypothetical protein
MEQQGAAAIMTIKIEKKAISVDGRASRHGDWDNFLAAVKACKVGESFVFPRSESNHRLALSIAQRWLNVRFRVATEGEKFRYGRIQ